MKKQWRNIDHMKDHTQNLKYCFYGIFSTDLRLTYTFFITAKLTSIVTASNPLLVILLFLISLGVQYNVYENNA